MNLEEAHKAAYQLSRLEQCTIHVNRNLDDTYSASDWSDSSTISTYTNGRQTSVAIMDRVQSETRSLVRRAVGSEINNLIKWYGDDKPEFVEQRRLLSEFLDNFEDTWDANPDY